MTIIHYDDLDPDTLKNFNLKHVGEDELTISRQKKGKGFCFYDEDGHLIKCEKEKHIFLRIR